MPRSPAPNPHAGGYSAIIQARIDRIILPEKAKCKSCKAIRNTAERFSNKQLLLLRHDIYDKGEPSLHSPGVIKCKSCVGTQVEELTCVYCHETKSLDDFFKAQRKNPDEARCKECAQRLDNTTPMNEAVAHVLDQGREYMTAQQTTINSFSELQLKVNMSADNNTLVGSTLLVNAQRAGGNSESAFTVGDTDAAASKKTKEGGVWIEQPRPGATILNSGQGSAGVKTGHNTKESYGRAGSVAGSFTPSELAEWAIPGSSSVHQQGHRPGNNPNFAKAQGPRVSTGQEIGLSATQLRVPGPDITTPSISNTNCVDDDDDEDEDFDQQMWM